MPRIINKQYNEETIMEPNDISVEVNRVVGYLSKQDPNTEEYTHAAQNLKTLCEARSKKQASLIEPEILISAGMNLLGVVLILRHEQFNVITSKAMNFIRPK